MSEETVTVAPTDEEILDQINAEFPGWRVWRPRRSDSQPPSWVATRHDDSVGVDATVMRSTAGELREQLLEQRGLAEKKGRIPLDLAAFWVGETS